MVVPRLFDRLKYRQRNLIERMFGWLKKNRRVVTRFDKLAKVMARWSRWLVLCGVCDTFFQTEPGRLLGPPARLMMCRGGFVYS